MTYDTADALEREFGCIPNEGAGEKWVVYQGELLLVFHPECLIKVYRRGGTGYFEIDPMVGAF